MPIPPGIRETGTDLVKEQWLVGFWDGETRSVLVSVLISLLRNNSLYCVTISRDPISLASGRTLYIFGHNKRCHRHCCEITDVSLVR